MSQISEFLESLGLGEYADTFEENAIDMEVIPELTDSDLKELGLKLGHRKKLLKAIDAFEETTPDTTPLMIRRGGKLSLRFLSF